MWGKGVSVYVYWIRHTILLFYQQFPWWAIKQNYCLLNAIEFNSGSWIVELVMSWGNVHFVLQFRLGLTWKVLSHPSLPVSYLSTGQWEVHFWLICLEQRIIRQSASSLYILAAFLSISAEQSPLKAIGSGHHRKQRQRPHFMHLIKPLAFPLEINWSNSNIPMREVIDCLRTLFGSCRAILAAFLFQSFIRLWLIWGLEIFPCCSVINSHTFFSV